MNGPRYVVGEVGGFLTMRVRAGTPDAVSVVVTDSAYCHRIVRQFRSEQVVGRRGGRLGADGARAAGRELADRLNGGLSR